MTSNAWSYEIDAEAGRGTSGVVLAATSKEGHKVAIKVFDSRKGSRESNAIIEYLEREFGIVQSLDHPNIVKYLEWGLRDGAPFIVMKPLAVETLEQRIERRQSLSPVEVAGFLSPVASALDYLHARSVLHRDIKPSNILFDSAGVPFLSDFGVAHQIPSRQSTFAEGAAFMPGTPDFMAPEVMEAAPPSRASDIYSLALTVYYALCQKLPSDGQSLHRRNVDRVAGTLVALCDRQPALSREISDVVMRGLATDPKNRYINASSFAAAFSLAMNGESTSPKKKVQEQQLLPSDSKSWLEYWKVIFVPILVAIIGAVAIWLKK